MSNQEPCARCQKIHTAMIKIHVPEGSLHHKQYATLYYWLCAPCWLSVDELLHTVYGQSKKVSKDPKEHKPKKKPSQDHYVPYEEEEL